jgi:predicted nucleic acid-binding protein
VALAYVDTSALVKLAVVEAETPALEADLAGREGLVASVLVVVECGRAARRAGKRRVLQRIEELLQAVYLIDLSAPLLEEAASLAPASMRSLDAIHLATALSIGDPELEVITYDGRMAEAARANGLRLAQPGR